MAIRMSGNFMREVNNYHQHIEANYPQNGEDFVIPSRNEMSGLLDLAIAARSFNVTQCESIISSYNFPYEVVWYTDTGAGGRRYLYLREKHDKGDHRGWGIYAWAETSICPVTVKVTHPISDKRTHEIGARMFQKGVKAFFMHGSHRYSYPSPSDQGDGHFSDRIALSDPSGADLIPIQAFHLAHCRQVDTLVEIHGFSRSRFDYRRDYPDIIVSEGAPASPGSSRIKAIVSSINRETSFEAGLYHGNVKDGYYYDDLGAEANRAGNWTNSLLPDPGHFVHFEVEQYLRFRRTRQTADALFRVLKAVFPNEDTWLFKGRSDRTVPLTAHVVSPKRVRIHFSGPLLSAGSASHYTSDLNIQSVSLLHAGYTVEVSVSGMNRGEGHYISVGKAVTDKYGQSVQPKTVHFVGVSQEEVYTGCDIPLQRTRKNQDTFPSPDIHSEVRCSGANLIRTRPVHHYLKRDHIGTKILFKKRRKDFYPNYYKLSVIPQQQLWFRADIYVPETLTMQSQSCYVARIQENTDNMKDGIRLNIRKQKGEYYWQIRDRDGRGTGVLDNCKVKRGQWQTVEFSCTVDDPDDGAQKEELWVDNVKVADMTLSVAVQSVDHILIGINYLNQPEIDDVEIYMSNIRVSTSKHPASEDTRCIATPELATDVREIVQQKGYTEIRNEKVHSIHIQSPVHFGNQDVKIQVITFAENGGLLDSVDSAYVPNGTGSVTVSLPNGLRPGITIRLRAMDADGLHSDWKTYHFERVEAKIVEEVNTVLSVASN